MGEIRTLPPLIHGKVTAVLDFTVAEIVVFRNITFLSHNFDVIVQVQWWGEISSAYMRPQKILISNKYKNFQLVKSCSSSAKYEIKTTLDLFKSYLQTCEKLELVVWEVETAIIGSAFLHNLITLINRENEEITIPLIDYLGEEIGKIKILINFTEVPQKIYTVKQTATVDLLFREKNLSTSKNTITKINFPNEKTIFANLRNNKFQPDIVEVPEKKHIKAPMLQNSEEIINSKVQASNAPPNSPISVHTISSLNQNDNPSDEAKNFLIKSLPEGEFFKDSSKILDFKVHFKKKTNNSNNIKLHSTSNSSNKSTKQFTQEKPVKKLMKKPVINQNKNIKLTETNSKNVFEIKKQPSEINIELLPGNQKSCPNMTNQMFIPKVYREQNYESTQKLTEKNLANKKVLDYLLGSQMSKEDEEIALNDFRKMSPSHDLVFSVGQLYIDNSSEKPDKHKFSCIDPVKSVQSSNARVSGLNFDLNNPVERKYYEKFFLQTNNTQNDFEIAELLNQPKNCFELQNDKSDDQICLKKAPVENEVYESFPESSEKINYNSKDTDIAKTCTKCKYYKKLDELDSIIESLKNFEKKTVFYEKDKFSESNHV